MLGISQLNSDNITVQQKKLGYGFCMAEGLHKKLMKRFKGTLKKRAYRFAQRISDRLHPRNASGNNTSMR